MWSCEETEIILKILKNTLYSNSIPMKFVKQKFIFGNFDIKLKNQTQLPLMIKLKQYIHQTNLL